MSVLIFSLFNLEKGMEWDFHQAGIYPHHPESLGGIIGILFVHSDWSHLFNNLFSFALLSVCLFYFYHDIALRFSGLSFWLTGLMFGWLGGNHGQIAGGGWLIVFPPFCFSVTVPEIYFAIIQTHFLWVFIINNHVYS